MKAFVGDYIKIDKGPEAFADRIIDTWCTGREEIYECESGTIYSENDLGMDDILLESEVDCGDCYPDYDGQPDEAQEWHDFDPDC